MNECHSIKETIQKYSHVAAHAPTFQDALLDEWHTVWSWGARKDTFLPPTSPVSSLHLPLLFICDGSFATTFVPLFDTFFFSLPSLPSSCRSDGPSDRWVYLTPNRPVDDEECSIYSACSLCAANNCADSSERRLEWHSARSEGRAGDQIALLGDF